MARKNAGTKAKTFLFSEKDRQNLTTIKAGWDFLTESAALRRALAYCARAVEREKNG